MRRQHLPTDMFPQDFEGWVNALQEKIEQFGNGKTVGFIGAVAFVLWLASGLYVVGPGERGVVRLFGEVVDQTEPGLAYRFPWPIQTHDIVDVSRVRRVEMGFRSTTRGTDAVPAEALMLTGDENIVDVQLFVQYLVHDPVKFLFRARDPEGILRAGTEVALRGVVGQNSIDYTMTEGRVEIQDRAKTYLQKLLDTYDTGVLITEARLLAVDPPREVREAFHDVVRAREDRERLIREAEGYREDVVPKARGEATQIRQQAEAYKAQRTIRAEGDAAKFLSVLEEYNKAKLVTRDRLYLESIDHILPGAKKFILANGGQANSVLPLLPLQALTAASENQPPLTAMKDAR